MNTPTPKSFFPDIENLNEAAAELRAHDLLDQYIARKLRSMPRRVDRSGVPRGTPLPLPAKKARAALLHLRLGGDLPDLQALAREARVSYSLLGKWRTEARFRELIEQSTKEFGGWVLAWIYEWVNDNFRPPPTLDIPNALEVVSHLGTIERWSPHLRNFIGFALLAAPPFQKDQHPSIRLVRGLVGWRIIKDLLDPAKSLQHYRNLREQARKMVEPALARMQEAIRTKNLALLADHVTMLEALLKPVLNQEYWAL